MKTYRVTVNGNQYDVTVEETASVQANVQAAPPQSIPVPKAPVKADIPKPAAQPVSTAPTGSIEVKSPLPGSIFKIPVKAGENVKKGQVIVIIEAMKMENEIMAPSDGTIASVNVSEGSSINTGDLLLTMNS